MTGIHLGPYPPPAQAGVAKFGSVLSSSPYLVLQVIGLRHKGGHGPLAQPGRCRARMVRAGLGAGGWGLGLGAGFSATQGTGRRWKQLDWSLGCAPLRVGGLQGIQPQAQRDGCRPGISFRRDTSVNFLLVLSKSI